MVPSVSLVLCEWKLDEDWKTQELVIIGSVEKVKQALLGRSTRIMLILLVKKDLNDHSDPKIEDFLNNLRKITGLDSRTLTTLDERDFNNSISSKFAKGIFDLSISYYRDVLLRLKKLKNEAKSLVLQIRHKIKTAFFNEILGSTPKVQKSFEFAYNLLTELKDDKYSVSEIRLVADYVNFKICQSKFSEKKIDAAIKQFLNHMTWFRKGEIELVFEYWALLYRQYRIFAEMLEKQIDSNHNYGPFGNPGYFFECAANSYRNRKKHALKVIEPNKDLISKSFDMTKIHAEDEAKLKTGFIGQRSKGFQGVNFLREIACESQVNHSEDIIRMLTKAYDHYYKRNQKRMIYFIANLIAEEHLYCGRFEKAKKFFERILSHYKKDGWFVPLTNILKSSIMCCKELKLYDQFVSFSLELLSDKNMNSLQERQQVLQQVLDYLENSTIGTLNQVITIPMELNHSLLTLKCQFENPFVAVFDNTSFRINLIYRGPQALTFSNLAVVFNLEQYNILTSENLMIKPGENTFSFPMVIRDKRDLECISISLTLGSETKQIVFKWQMVENKYHFSWLNTYDYRNEIGQGLFVHRPVIRLTEPQPNLTVQLEHFSPILVNEFYPIKIKLFANQDTVLGGKINVMVNESLVKLYDSNLQPFREYVKFDHINPQENLQVLIWIQTKAFDTTNVQFHIEYNSSKYQGMLVDQSLELKCLFPFQPVFTVESTRQTNLNEYQLISNSKTFIYQIKENEMVPFELKEEKVKKEKILYPDYFTPSQNVILTSRLTLSAPFPVKLSKISSRGDNFALVGQETPIEGTILNNKDVITLVSVFKPQKVGDGLSLGEIRLCFQRNGSDTYNEIIMKLPHINIFNPDCFVTTSLPKDGQVGQLFKSCVTVHNQGSNLKEFTFSVADSDGFVYSGPSSIVFMVLPNSKRDLYFSFVPLLSGHQVLPKFTISHKNSLIVHEDEEWVLFVKP